jgi:hypothetical protein
MSHGRSVTVGNCHSELNILWTYGVGWNVAVSLWVDITSRHYKNKGEEGAMGHSGEGEIEGKNCFAVILLSQFNVLIQYVPCH